MKKLICVLLAVSLLSLVTPISFVSASPTAHFTGGELDGVEGKYGAYNNTGNVQNQTPTSMTPRLTDDNITTAFTLAPNTMVWFDIPEGFDMRGFRYVGDLLLDVVVWYNATSGASVSNSSPFANGTFEGVNWNGVKRVALTNNTAQSRVAYEFNVYASDYTMATQAYFEGGMLDGQTLSITAYSNTANINNQTITSYTTLLTDNNLGTSFTLPPKTMAYFNFPAGVNITSYRVSGSNSNLDVMAWYSITGGLSLIDTTTTVTSVPESLNWNGVRRVAISNDTAQTYTVYDFNVYGTGFTPPDNTPPSTPTGVSLSSGSSQVTVSWNANTEPDVKGYNIYQDGVLIQTVMHPATSLTLSGLTGGTTYNFQVSAIDNADNESPRSALTPITVSLSRPQEINKGINNITPELVVVNYVNPKEVDLYSLLPYQYSRQAATSQP